MPVSNPVTGPLLSVENLSVEFRTASGVNRAVDGVSLSLNAGETLAIVGESGSGKSVLSRAIMRLLPTPPAQITGGRITVAGRSILDLPSEDLRRMRGTEMAMIFQEPMLSLNPLMTVGAQIVETLRAHRALSRREARGQAVALLTGVGIADPDRRADQFPHEMSGGMRQRVMIAMALACEPKLLIADEPTTALDVTIQAQVLYLINQLKARTGMGVILVTHNFGVVNQVADRVAVMYAGGLVETATKSEILRRPAHPYTRGLLASVPKLHGDKGRIPTIEGTMAPGTALPKGCRFHPRCGSCMEICRHEAPPSVDLGGGHISNCWLSQTEAAQPLEHTS